WTIALDTRFKRLAVDNLHRVEALTILITVMNDPSYVRMLNLRGRARLAEKSRPCGIVFDQCPSDYFQRHRRIKNCIACAIGDRHRSGAKYLWIPIGIYFDFEVRVTQWTLPYYSIIPTSLRLLFLR